MKRNRRKTDFNREPKLDGIGKPFEGVWLWNSKTRQHIKPHPKQITEGSDHGCKIELYERGVLKLRLRPFVMLSVKQISDMSETYQSVIILEAEVNGIPGSFKDSNGHWWIPETAVARFLI